MKLSDVTKIHEAGLITDEQRDRIISRFNLKEEGSRFMVIVSFIGAVLVAVGVALVIAAHWNGIPPGVKIAAGLALMLGAHGAGWWLREVRRNYPKTGEALQFLGSALWLANLALISQIYHLPGRLPDLFLIWWLGIAALPWLLRSRAQFFLLLAAFAIWFGCEINESGSLIYSGNDSQVLAYALLGLNYVGAGYWLRRTSFASFAPVVEKLGMFGLLCFAYPVTWAGFLNWWRDGGNCPWLLPVLGALGVATAATGVRQLPGLNRQWRATWAVTLVLASVLLCALTVAPHDGYRVSYGSFDSVNALAAAGMFVFCLLQIQTGLQMRSPYLVNLGIAFIGLDIFATYIGLFGTMMRTGMAFVVAGVFLILFSVWLERKRRKLMKQIRTPATPEAQ